MLANFTRQHGMASRAALRVPGLERLSEAGHSCPKDSAGVRGSARPPRIM